MRNLRRHLHQLQGYFDTSIEEMETGDWTSIIGSLLYPARPASSETLATIEAVAGEEAIMVTWYEDVDWHRPACLSIAVRARQRTDLPLIAMVSRFGDVLSLASAEQPLLSPSSRASAAGAQIRHAPVTQLGQPLDVNLG
jgi:hypothetical protein